MKETLRTLFQHKFNPIEYRKVMLQNLLHSQELLREPQFLEETNDGDRIYGLGYFYDAENKQVGLYYTEVAKGDVRRKRVGFRQMMKSYVRYGADAAIAVFADSEHWRLSYMSDLKGGETSAKRFSYIMGDPNGQYNTPVNRLADLAKGKITIEKIFGAFSVESLSNEFFDKYHDHYDAIVDELAKQGKVGAQYHDYVKKMMGRIVFLHFLQKKRWLDDDPEFLKNLFFMQPLDRRADFLEQVLEPLFFGIFNTESDQREALFAKEQWDRELLKQWESLPYLNGGLFERDAVDKIKIMLPASLFEDLFTFMSSYNFTVDENDPDDAEVGVDPEMLGKIFESLLEDNKTKGAFYTPKEIVRYMCKESLIAYLDSKLAANNASEKHNLNNPAQESVSTASVPEGHNLNNPAQESAQLSQCGGVSEARNLKTAIRAFVETHEMQPELEPYRDTLDQALREVKICDPAIGSGAFPMGLLNELWRCREALQDTSEQLAKKAGDTSENPLRAGGTRPQTRVELKKEIIENNIYGVDIERGAIDIARLRFWLSIVVDADKPEPLPNFDYKFMQGNSLIESFDGFDLSRIASRPVGRPSTSVQLTLGLDSHTNQCNLHRLIKDYFRVTDHQEKAHLRQQINDEVKLLIINSLGTDRRTQALLDKLDPSANQDFFLWHTWFKDIFDNGGFDIVIGNPPYVVVEADGKYSHYETESSYDLYAYFFERATKLLCNNGILSFITSSLYVKGIKYKSLRSFLQNNVSLIAFRIEGDDVFKNAGIPTATFIAIKTKSSWKFEDLYVDRGLTAKIKQGTVTLSAVSTIMRGFEIGRNMVESSGQFKFLTGSDVSKYCYNKLSYISQAVLDAFSKDIKYFSKERILLRETGSFLTAIYLGEETIYSNRSLYSILITDKALNTKYVLALLNSKLFQWYYSTMFKGDTELFPKIRIAQAKLLPILKVDKAKQRPIIELIDKLLCEKKQSTSDTSTLEREIDELVYQLYNLTPEEIAIIEQ